tara:strand:- start:18367 stop:18738 length:372 start_codon:yes stop_codon:yes gene_type:complete
MIKNIILLAVIFVLVDAGFLYLMSNNFQTMVKKIQGSPLKMNLYATLACYIVLVSSLYYFVIYKNGSYLDAFLLGFFIYAVYETTNMAIFKDWSVSVGLIDLTWGGFLFLITTYLYKNSIKYI